jgi:hypothetical protein
MAEQLPHGHEDMLCNHCGSDVRNHTDEEVMRHANLAPNYKIQRHDALSKGLKLGQTVKEVAESMPGGKLTQGDMKHLMGRDNPKDDPFELPEFMK